MTDLNAFNYLNLVGFIINTLITFGASPVFGFPDNGELSLKYQTIVSPAGFTFGIWGIIFISQGIFSVMQMLPAYRYHPLIQEGVSYWYFSACIFQSIWTFAFGYEVFALSVLMMGGILCSLVPIVIQQSKIDSHPSSAIGDFWQYKYPFSIHCGWIAAAFAVNVNVYISSQGYGAAVLEQWAYITIVYAILCAGFALFYLSPPDFTIPSVLVWATFGIALELRNPEEAIENLFEEDIIARVRGLVIALCIALGIVTTGYGIYLRVVGGKNESTRSSNGEGNEGNEGAEYNGNAMTA